MIDPIEEKRAGLITHAIGENARKRVRLQKRLDAFKKEILRLVAKRPVELFLRLGGRLSFVKSCCGPHHWALCRRAPLACAELDPLGQRKLCRKVNRVGLAAHVIFPGVASTFAAAAGVFLAAKSAANLRAARASV